MVPEEAQRALSTLVDWLGRVVEGDSKNELQSLDDSVSRAYLHSYRDEFTRVSLFLVWPSTCKSLLCAARTALCRKLPKDSIQLPESW